jgi:hypothetical protein
MYDLIGVIFLSIISSIPFIVAIQAHIETNCQNELNELNGN